MDKVGLRPYTDRWCYRDFQSAPDLIRELLTGSATASMVSSGPTKALQVFLEQQVMWLNLEELSRQPNLDPLLNLLTEVEIMVIAGIPRKEIRHTP